MNSDVEVMLYVSNLEQEAAFWQEIGFVERDRQEDVMVQVAPNDESGFALNLFSLAFIQENTPEVANNVPSIMFHSDEIDDLYAKMQAASVEVGELVEMGLQKVFSFNNTDGLSFTVSGI